MSRAAQAVQSVSVRLANPGAAPPRCEAVSTHDLLKAQRIAELIAPGEAVLDVGCGCGDRLVQVSLFRPDIEATGVDVSVGWPTLFRGVKAPRLQSYDGRTLPFEDRRFDTVMSCYTLHHLSLDASAALLEEMRRCAKRRLILLEDSVPAWSFWYQLRNWAHIVDTDIQYGSSLAYAPRRGVEGFLTRDAWCARLSALPGVRSVRFVSLDDISRYQHHSLFVVELDGAASLR
ncbi:MAG: methyltransferase domain-containing protein [Myxococcales bacterium]|nr:methyltransferase domain-containing protein [Myxococcales bacterium]